MYICMYLFVLYRILNLEDQMILFKTACQFFIAANKKVIFEERKMLLHCGIPELFNINDIIISNFNVLFFSRLDLNGFQGIQNDQAYATQRCGRSPNLDWRVSSNALSKSAGPFPRFRQPCYYVGRRYFQQLFYIYNFEMK